MAHLIADQGGTLFGRPVVKTVWLPGSMELQVTNDEGKTVRLTEAQLHQMHLVRQE